jgi:hypothetical protein
LKTLKTLANFEATPSTTTDSEKGKSTPPKEAGKLLPPENLEGKRPGLNLSYTINLNLPATSDQAVFNAIFKSLKEYLLNDDE